MHKDWLKSTYALQADTFGIALPFDDHEVLDRLEYLCWNFQALVEEVIEAQRCMNWKPWKKTGFGNVDRAAMLDELVDVAHFVGNILCALGVDDEEWFARYHRKQLENDRRQKEGY